MEFASLLLCISSNPVCNAILIKVVLLTKYNRLTFFQLTEECERGSIVVIPENEATRMWKLGDS
jgi:hypothetical protein